MNSVKKEKNYLFILLLTTIFFNFAFPKAGVKLLGIPLTIGNLFFAFTFFIWCVKKIQIGKMSYSKIGLLILLLIIFFSLKYFIIGNFIDNIGYIIPLIVYPLIFFMTYDLIDSPEKVNKILKLLVICYFIITLYALLQFFVGIENCAIPGLTVNYSDFKEYGKYWFMMKSNGIDISMSKIVSTYQNGNLFGVNMLLCYPIIYSYLKNKKRNKLMILSLILFIFTVFLSLSRACWLGIVLFLFIAIFMEKNKYKSSLAFKFFMIILCVFSLIIVFSYMPSVANRFLNTKLSDWISMSGRTEGLISILNEIKETPNIFAILFGFNGIINYNGLAYEMFPLALFVQGGIIGLIIFYVILFNVLKKFSSKNFILLSIRLSIFIWMIVGIIECGFWLPPFSLNLFTIIAFGYSIKKLKCENRYFYCKED